MYVSREVRLSHGGGGGRGREKGWLGSHCTMPSSERPPLHTLDMHFLPPTIPHELLPRFYDILCRFLLLLTLVHTKFSMCTYVYVFPRRIYQHVRIYIRVCSGWMDVCTRRVGEFTGSSARSCASRICPRGSLSLPREFTF